MGEKREKMDPSGDRDDTSRHDVVWPVSMKEGMVSEGRIKHWSGHRMTKEEIAAMAMLLDAEWSEVNLYFIHVGREEPFKMILYNPDGSLLYKEDLNAQR